ncbi:MAG: chloride channel protein [Bacteroidales bacterium]|nr:chloride channel protein [Bacteroidales bacterium]
MAATTIPARFRAFLTGLPERNKLLILSLAVGLASGLSAVVLTKLIALVRAFVDGLPTSSYNWQYLISPGVGMLLSLLLVRYVIRDRIGHGVTRVLVAVSKNESRIKPHNMWSSMAASAVTIGFGGSVGAEAPIVLTGAAIGSNFASFMKLSYRDITLMLGCGAAGAIAGIFKAPLAGVLFTMEILLFNISMTSLLPLLLSTVSATVVAYLFNGQAAVFQCNITPFSMGNIPFYIVLGIMAGFGSLYFTRVTLWLEDRVAHFKAGVYWKWLICAVALGLLLFLFPSLYGEGYDSLVGLLKEGYEPSKDASSFLAVALGRGWAIPLFFLLVFLLKVFAMTLTNAGGGVGGTFGPTLFEGAVLGFLVARALNLLLGGAGISVPEQNFTLVGMAALMAGVMQAPMTAIFLIAETTGGYGLLVPLIIAATISYGTTRIFEKYSIYTKRIAKTGELLTHDSDQAVLTLLKTADLVRDKYPRIPVDASLREVIPVISQSNAAVFPVLDAEGRFQGLIDIDSVRKIMFRSDLYDKLRVRNIMEQPAAYVYVDEKIEDVLKKFERTDAWRLPVVTDGMKYLGFMSKSRILLAYREELKAISQD